ncbi:MAG: PhzF family phenazine biosynthesis protein [Woeseia sp.]|nr:PhzF family phenazine biosynthesis protein [Woeseia sp.]NNE61169.1 PhzF family phenazine biosynthesis protein [Woeseia sp.]
MGSSTLYRLSAFSDQPDGGNPAGVWIGNELPDSATMLGIAADVGYSETAFIAPSFGKMRTVRYYSPEAEVSFCGHATIATGVVLGELEGEGSYNLSSAVGEVIVAVQRDGPRFTAALTSVEPRHERPSAQLLNAALDCLNWRHGDLDPNLPPAKAYAGAWHLVIPVAKRERLESLEYDFQALKMLMQLNDLTTLQLVWRESAGVFHSRNPFPVGGVVEDPATGAAAAAMGGYLRDAGLLNAPATFKVRQGEAMGRPSLLTVQVPKSGGIVVSGTAVKL